MRAVDTNLVVRMFAEDDLEQADIAEHLLTTEPIFLPKTVILEFEWVMRSVYRESVAAISAAIQAMLSTANVQVEDHAVVARAVGWFRRGMDLADALHLASSGHVDAFVTFDASMRRRAASLGIETPVIAP